MTKKFWRCGLGLLVLFALIQLIPVDRSNPPVTAELSAPNQLMTIFRRCCYDCHSNETVWPWYSRSRRSPGWSLTIPGKDANI